MTPQNPLLQLAPLLLIFVLFYVLMIVPMRKRQKAVQQMVENLKKGDRVITNGGLYGEVVAVDRRHGGAQDRRQRQGEGREVGDHRPRAGRGERR